MLERLGAQKIKVFNKFKVFAQIISTLHFNGRNAGEKIFLYVIFR
jgi:hypothetical protein